MADFRIRPLVREDRLWVARYMEQAWGSTQMVTRGKLVYAHLLPGLVAEHPPMNPDPGPLGLLTYHLEGEDCEIISLNSLEEGRGVGTGLVEALLQQAQADQWHRLWLIATNDNLNALRFWQRRGFVLVSVYRNAVEQARRVKPQIPVIGSYGIPIRDEIELEYPLR